MNKKLVMVASCVVALIAGTVFTAGRRASGTKAQVGVPEATSQSVMPEHAAYEFLFRRADRFRQSAAKAGQPLALDSGLQREARLNNDQVRVLGEIAADCLQEVTELDQRARVIINQFRSRFPDRVVPQDAQLAPPPELEALQRQRDCNGLSASGSSTASAASCRNVMESAGKG
jgi:hypothetical protein